MADIRSLNDVFRVFFADPDLKIELNTTAAHIPGWDSIAQVGLLMTIEKKFGVKFDFADLYGLRNVGELLDLLNRLENQE